ncbi:hypothetical protein ACE10Z_24720 [Bradyrhizobium sp. Pha-3]|uniref:hypothetical protein n=1 Tax=Bradyrhizobium sp. Pha-3 TaxID=208375 RepID=UPI0035D511C9
MNSIPAPLQLAFGEVCSARDNERGGHHRGQLVKANTQIPLRADVLRIAFDDEVDRGGSHKKSNDLSEPLSTAVLDATALP